MTIEGVDQADLAQLTEAARDLTESVKALQRFGYYNRVAISVLTLIVAAVGLLGLYARHVAVQAAHASSAASQAKITLHASCVAGNLTRALNQQLFTSLVHATTPPNASPTQLASAQRFLALVDTTFVQRQC
jgi:hypothetical protein